MMKHSLGATEGGTVVGNTYPKYETRNPIARAMVRNFQETMDRLVSEVSPVTIHEVGCGEGFWVLRWRSAGIAARGSDFSHKVIDIARDNARRQEQPPGIFSVRSIYDPADKEAEVDLVVCCEVLEHLEDPEGALDRLSQVKASAFILSVPREPWWRMLNVLRGSYLRSCGNTPGHLQHWSKSSFVRFAARRFDVAKVCAPFPWSMLLCKPLKGH